MSLYLFSLLCFVTCSTQTLTHHQLEVSWLAVWDPLSYMQQKVSCALQISCQQQLTLSPKEVMMMDVWSSSIRELVTSSYWQSRFKIHFLYMCSVRGEHWASCNTCILWVSVALMNKTTLLFASICRYVAAETAKTATSLAAGMNCKRTDLSSHFLLPAANCSSHRY